MSITIFITIVTDLFHSINIGETEHPNGTNPEDIEIERAVGQIIALLIWPLSLPRFLFPGLDRRRSRWRNHSLRKLREAAGEIERSVTEPLNDPYSEPRTSHELASDATGCESDKMRGTTKEQETDHTSIMEKAMARGLGETPVQTAARGGGGEGSIGPGAKVKSTAAANLVNNELSYQKDGEHHDDVGPTENEKQKQHPSVQDMVGEEEDDLDAELNSLLKEIQAADQLTTQQRRGGKSEVPQRRAKKHRIDKKSRKKQINQ